MAAVRCLFCNRSNPVDAKFCNDCGTALDSKPCRQCQATNSRAAARCGQCGSVLAPEATLQNAAAGWSDVRSDLAAILGTVPAWDDPMPPAGSDRLSVASKPSPGTIHRPVARATDAAPAVPTSRAVSGPASQAVQHPIPVLIPEIADVGRPRRRPIGLAVAAAMIGVIGASLFVLGGEAEDSAVATPISSVDGHAGRSTALPDPSPQVASIEVAVSSTAANLQDDSSALVASQAREANADVAAAAALDPGTTLPVVPGETGAVVQSSVQPPATDRQSPGIGRTGIRQSESTTLSDGVQAGGAAPRAPAVPNRLLAGRDQSPRDQASAASVVSACTDAAAALGFCQASPAVVASKAPIDSAPAASVDKPRASEGATSEAAGNGSNRIAADGGRPCTSAVAALGLCDRGQVSSTGASAGSASTTVAGQVRGGQEH